MIKNQKPRTWLLWHPHQGLWNWWLISVIQARTPNARLSDKLCRAIIHADSLLLFIRAVLNRIWKVGIKSIFKKATIPETIPIIYLDIGTHKEGAELNLVTTRILPPVCSNFQAYGFEANPDSFADITSKFRVTNPKVRLINRALVRTVPETGKIKLYKDHESGLGDSLFRPGSEFFEVDCMRLSDFLVDNKLSDGKSILILRMNIEGSEIDVIEDLVDHNFHRMIDGYFGMWDDVAKIDIEQDSEFRHYLSRHGIQPFTFNGRDLSWPLRRRSIEYAIHTSLLCALRDRSVGSTEASMGSR